MPEPTIQQIADAVKHRKGLESKKVMLEKRKAHLEQSISDLDPDTPDVDVQWYKVELRKTETDLETVSTKLDEIDALTKAEELREEADQKSGLVELYESSRADGTFDTLPAALRERSAEAYREAGERKLLANRD